MTNYQIKAKLEKLEPSFRMEVYDFIEFLFSKQSKSNKIIKPVFGCAKGRFRISDDFDEPLDDLKEYMF